MQTIYIYIGVTLALSWDNGKRKWKLLYCNKVFLYLLRCLKCGLKQGILQGLAIPHPTERSTNFRLVLLTHESGRILCFCGEVSGNSPQKLTPATWV